MKFSIKAPAKVNLFLDVLSKRPDGYHNINSVMQSISLCDEVSLEVTRAEKNEISVCGTSDEIKWDESNLVYKACSAFIKKAGLDGYRFDFHVQKNIPVCAGMAGGSTDAAAALILMNKAFGNLFSVERLCELGAGLGADVAFCIVGGTCLCEGIGEKLTALPSIRDMYMVCAIDSSCVSTPKAYAMLDEKYGSDCTQSADCEKFLKALKNASVKEISALLYNKFESVIAEQNPSIQKIKDMLFENGALGALMSGSGPSVFGIFETESEQRQAFEALEKAKIRVFLCKSL